MTRVPVQAGDTIVQIKILFGMPGALREPSLLPQLSYTASLNFQGLIRTPMFYKQARVFNILGRGMGSRAPQYHRKPPP